MIPAVHALLAVAGRLAWWFCAAGIVTAGAVWVACQVSRTGGPQ
jgi:hypothetical protein